MSGHTPGPWVLTENGYIRAKCYEGDYDTGDGLGLQHCFPSLCDLRPWPKSRWPFLHRDETDANAHLIAAAPDLLVAAKAARDLLETRHDEISRITVAVLVAAIDKAESRLALVPSTTGAREP